jgi:hypothetical protein
LSPRKKAAPPRPAAAEEPSLFDAGALSAGALVTPALDQLSADDLGTDAATAPAVVADLREIALAWAENRPTLTTERLVPYATGRGRTEADSSWRLDAVAAFVLDAAPIGPPPAEPRIVQRVTAFVRTVAGARVLELFLAASGVELADFAEDVGGDRKDQGLGSLTGPLGAFVTWASHHFGGDLGPALDVIFGHVVYAALRTDRERLRAQLAEQQGDTAERRRLPMLRRGMALQRTLLQTDARIAQRHRSLQRSGRLSEVEREARREFVYDPLGWSERLVLHALASIAREERLLDAHPWATASGAMPLPGGVQDAPRVRVGFPGSSEIARIVFGRRAEGQSGRVTGGVRRTLQNALRNLINTPRWIAVDVLKQDGQGWYESTEIQKDLWVRMSAGSGGRDIPPGAFLDLHPAAIASHLRSFEDIPELGAEYEAALERMGLREMRDDLAIADDYLRYLARSIAAAEARRSGPTPDRASTEAVLQKKLGHDTLIEKLKLQAWAKKQGKRAGQQRVAQVLEFCLHMGSLREAAVFEDGFWHLTMPYPTGSGFEVAQLEAFPQGVEPSQLEAVLGSHAGR